MPKNNKTTKTTSQNKSVFVIILVMAALLVIAVGIILFMLLSNSSADNTSDVDQGNSSESGYEVDNDKSQSSEDEYGKSNPIIMITDRNTPVSTSEEDGHFVQTAEVNMYCDLQDGYEISNTSGKAYKGDKPTKSQMDYENSQTYHKYSQYGSVALICTGHGSYRKSDKWKLSHHYLKIDYDNITDDGRFTFTEEAWLNPDGSTKEFRDFVDKLIRILSTTDDTDTLILEDYHVKMHFILNRDTQEFLDSWRKIIDAR